jgi:predicted nucleic acid-binding protein
MRKILLDTNALLDLILPRDVERHAAMRAVVAACREGETELMLSALSLKDASYVIENSAAMKAAFPQAQDRRERSRYARDVAFTLCTIVAVDEEACRCAHRNTSEEDYDDALIAACAVAAKADMVVTSDARAFNSADVPFLKLSPGQCAKLLRMRPR